MTSHESGDLVGKFFKGINTNTFFLIIGFAALWYLSQIFVTKEIYYRDQVRLEQTLKEIKDGQNKLFDYITKK